MTARELNDLFDVARSGDIEAEHRLFSYLGERFRRFARHRIANDLDADEVTQEAIMTICREYKSIEITVSISAWAYKVMDNRILTYLQGRRTMKQRVSHQPNALDYVPAVTVDVELRRRLLECLRKICAAHRRYARVLNLHSQGYETSHICDRLDLKENTLYSLLHRGRAMLRRCLETGEIG